MIYWIKKNNSYYFEWTRLNFILKGGIFMLYNYNEHKRVHV